MSSRVCARAAAGLWLACVLYSLPAGAQSKHRVLLLNSYHHGYEWSDDIVRGVLASVNDGTLKAELHIEYADWRRHTDAAYVETVAAYYKAKFANLPFDLVIASDDYAVNFMLKQRDSLFPNTPVIFCGVNEFNGSSNYVRAPEYRGFLAGILETVEVEETAKLALRLHPATRRIMLLGDENPDQERELRGISPDVQVMRVRSQRYSISEVERELKRLPRDSVVVLSAMSFDSQNQQFALSDSTRRIADWSPVPVYGMNKNTLGHGIVGGKLSDGYAQGQGAARLARAVLEGAKPADLGVQDVGANSYMFDDRALKRWGIRESALPAGSVIINKPTSLYQEHKGAVWGAIAFVSAQGLAIALLVAGRAKRRRYAEALQLSEEKLAGQVRDFEALLRVIPVGIGVAENPECTVIRTNPAFAGLLGLPDEENASMTRDGGAPPLRIFRDGIEVHPSELPMQVAAREGREIRDFELEVHRGDGQIIHEYGHATPLFDQHGKVRGSLGVFVDMTERNRAEEALRQSENRFRHLADSMPQIVWTAGPDGVRDYHNQRWYEFTGRSNDGRGDEDWIPMLHPDDVQPYLETWKSCVESGEPFQVEYRFWDRHTGRYRWQLGRALPARDDAGHILKWFGTSTDIDDQKRTEEALRRANADLEQFAYSASHDLQEPLRNVAIYSQMLGKKYSGALDGQAEEFLGYMVEGATRMETLLKGLLAYTEATGATEASAPVDANAVLETTLRDLHQTIEENHALVTHGPLPRVKIQAIHLEQLFQNLISNGIKYRSAAPPKIEVTAQREGSCWIFSVRDNGIGIDPQYARQVFGIFKRLHSRDRYAGAGIGLAICQRIVERQGGRIWVESKLGEGSSFRFSLPIEEGVNPA